VHNGARSGSLQRLRALGMRLAIAAALLTASFGQLAHANAADQGLSVDDVGSDLAGLVAVVAHSGNGVNLRADPSIGADVIDTLPDGTRVRLRIDEVDTVKDADARWWPVHVKGKDGWIAGIYLELAVSSSSSSAESSSSSDSSEPSGLETPDLNKGDFVAVKTDTGGGLAMRVGPSTDSDRLAGLGEGDVVQVIGGPYWDDNGDGWYKITDGDISAYVFGAFLIPAPELKTKAKTASVTDEEVAFSSGDFVAPAAGTGGVNVRSRASANSRIMASVGEGAVAQVTDQPTFDKSGAAWYPVQFGDATGFMLGDLLVASAAAAAPAAAPAPTSGPTGTFIYPLAGFTLTQGYGCTSLSLEPYDANLGCYFHNGVDLAAPAYTPIMASDGGTVVAAGWCDCGLGYYVEIDHGNGFHTLYGHMAEQPYVSVGQQVNQGDVIGPVGSTGASTGPHTHFMIELNGNTVDPLSYLSS
jgi:murein DD-endopeptidase MepM/ murein hydrolase activator NlpD